MDTGGSVKHSDEIQKELSNTSYACSSLKLLSGGTANFIFKGFLTHPLEDGNQEVVVKHGEGYIASMPDFKIPTSRCHIEEECLKAISQMPIPDGLHRVYVPRLYYFNPDTNTQVQQYLPDAVDLKSYALQHFAMPDPARKPLSCELGHSLGTWLRRFHSWVSLPEQRTKLYDLVKSNKPMQDIKQMVNYSYLVPTIDNFPSIFGGAKEVFEQVERMAAAELARPDLEIIHGDFWTGNVLIPNKPLEKGTSIPVFIIDWEVCELGVPPLDLGQMIAELYELFLFKNMDEGKSLIDGFAAGYGEIDNELAFRTAIHIGTHLICWGSRVPNWGSDEQVREVVKTGKDLILRAWHKDRSFFEASDLACLFRRS
ncbi:kinase-like domain-containing protein [Cercophora newfieldiana]|uniref:Kinase-like domain-containing protein n=1 Tax=Cercophora newfieldiana TaxID=92897 RepID=A0AA40CR46_9PEZI|nr:kinase-like domain-containing protein [Cercophora newfieldiana]